MSRVFFTDRDLGKRFPLILAAAGLQVERHADHFPPDCADETWLAHVGRQGWVAITHDARIRYKPNELAAVIYHHVALLIVVGRVPYPLLAESFVATRQTIFDFLERRRPPFIAKVYRPSAAETAVRPNASGTIVLSYPR